MMQMLLLSDPREEFPCQLMMIKEELQDLTLKLQNLLQQKHRIEEQIKELKDSYHDLDYRLAQFDGRLKVVEPRIEKAHVKPKLQPLKGQTLRETINALPEKDRAELLAELLA